MATPVVTPAAIKTGPGVIRYAPLGTTIPTITAVASKLVATWTTWVDVGATDTGLAYAESISTSPVRVAESQYDIRNNVEAKAGVVRFAMSHIHDLSWKLAMNGGTIVTTGATTTKLSKYQPPLIGAEVRVMLAFQSLDDEEIIIWPQVLNTGSVETIRPAQGADKWMLPTEFAVELPDPAVLTTPYVRYVANPNSLAVSP